MHSHQVAPGYRGQLRCKKNCILCKYLLGPPDAKFPGFDKPFEMEPLVSSVAVGVVLALKGKDRRLDPIHSSKRTMNCEKRNIIHASMNLWKWF